MSNRAPKKPPGPIAPAPGPTTPEHAPTRPAVPLTPVATKIGEPAGNLKARSDAFKRRRGPGK
ncbi:MAG: hypothetical protein ABI809_07875 [Caldimonas sp.]